MVEALVHDINLSVEQDVVAAELRTARVIPINKGKDNMEIVNYYSGCQG